MTEPTSSSDATADSVPLNEIQQTFRGLLQYIAGIALLTHASFMAVFAWSKVNLLAGINVLSILCFVTVFFLARRNKVNLAMALVGLEVVGHGVVASFIVGWNTGFHHYIFLVIPVVVMSQFRPLWLKAATVFTVGMAYLGLGLMLRGSEPPHPLQPQIQEGLYYFNVFGMMLILSFLAGVYYYLISQANEALRGKTQDINNMLQNMPQGVLTITAGGAVHHEYSAYLETIFETRDIAGRKMMDLVFSGTNLGEDPLSQLEAAADACIGEDLMNFEFNSHLLVQEFDKTMPDGRVKSLELSWSPICDTRENVEKLMLCVRDVTEFKRLEKEAQSRKRELEIIGEILAISQEKYNEFIDGANQFVGENQRLIAQAAGKSLDTVNLLFRNMHTVKGNARTHGFRYLTNLVHVTEQAYDELRSNDEAEWDRKALLLQLGEVQSMLDNYAHINDTVLGRKGPGRRGDAEKFLMVEKEQLQAALQLLVNVDQTDESGLRGILGQVGKTLNMVGTERIDAILAGTLDSLPSLARELGKAAPVVHIEDHGIVVRNQVSSLIKNLFTHLLRNAMDHGLEAAETRMAQGKPAAGNIHIGVSVDDGKLWLRLHDDGRGLAIARIRQRAIDQHLIADAQHASPQALAQLVFKSGFSTADQVTEVSGRGVGMDAVKGFLQKEGGDILIRFLDDDTAADFRPFEVLINLPDKYAASPDAAMSFDALRARVQAEKPLPDQLELKV